MRHFYNVLTMAMIILPGIQQSAFAEIEEIVVTAQKRAENQQDVPIAMQSIAGDNLEKLGVSDAGDITDLFANLNTNAANEMNTGFTIRGVGTNNFHGNVARAVGVYQDEVSRGTPFSGVIGVYDMERVEVLRGPQNTLFGRNTTGGAINYISRKPSFDPGVEGYVTLKAGNEGAVDVEGAVGGGLADNFGVRASFKSSQRDGLFKNLAPGRIGEEMGERDRQSYRIQALWAPTDNTEVLLSYTAAENNGSNIGNKAFGLRDPNSPLSAVCSELPGLTGTSAYTKSNNCVTSFGNNPSTADDWNTVYNTSSARADVEIDTAFLKIDHEFDNGIIFSSITATDETTVLNADDNSGGPDLMFTPHQDAEFDQFSQEFRLQGETDKLRWIAGIYYFEEDMRLATIVRRDANGAVSPPPAPGAGQVSAYNFLDQTDEDLSVYAQIEYDVSDDVTITAGVRRTENEKEGVSLFGVLHTPYQRWAPPDALIPVDTVMTQAYIEQLRAAGQVEAVPQFNVDAAGDGVVEQDLSETGFKLGIDRKFERSMLYASYSRGFKAGGFDTRALAALNGDATRPVEPETLDAWELGYKWDSESGNLRVNAAVFFNVWEEMQVFATVGGIPALANIPESELMGAEVDLTWAPDDYWLINLGVGVLDSEITEAGTLSGISEGHETRNTPPFSITGSISRDIPLGDGNLNLFLKFRYQDEMVDFLSDEVGPAGTPVAGIKRDDFHTHDSQFELDLRGTYTFGSEEQYSVAVWVDNVTEEEYCNDIGLIDGLGDTDVDDLSATANCSPNPGMRLYGVTASILF